MAFPIRFRAEAIREVAFGSIGASYSAVGLSTANPGRLARLVNSTNQDIYFSLDGADDHFRLPSGTFLLFDVSTNQTTKENFLIPEGQFFYVKHAGVAPTSGNAWIEFVIGG